MTRYLKQKDTGRLYAYTDLLFARGDMELVQGDPFRQEEPAYVAPEQPTVEEGTDTVEQGQSAKPAPKATRQVGATRGWKGKVK